MKHRVTHPAIGLRWPKALSLALVLAWFGLAAEASSVRVVTLDEMLDRSELLFEGRVIAQAVHQDRRSGRIYTYVTFEVLDVLKGPSSAPTVRLRYLGGSRHGLTLSVSDLHIPAVGERGIYFVERQRPGQVHPLYGWSQGHLRMVRDPTSLDTHVTTSDGRVVYGVDRHGSARRGASGLSDGVAAGIRAVPRHSTEEPLSAEACKARLRELLDEDER